MSNLDPSESQVEVRERKEGEEPEEGENPKENRADTKRRENRQEPKGKRQRRLTERTDCSCVKNFLYRFEASKKAWGISSAGRARALQA